MGNIVATQAGGSGVVSVTETTLDGSTDTFTYKPNTNQRLVLRNATAGEKITLLDGSEVECRDDTLVIADHQVPVAIAGIMGGLGSSVDDDTQNILLESAFGLKNYIQNLYTFFK